MIDPAAPNGALPRRINYRFTSIILAPLCLGEALRRGALVTMI